MAARNTSPHAATGRDLVLPRPCVELNGASVRLIGREQEREALDDLLDAVEDGFGRACVLHGEPGMGKTRLLEYATETRPQIPNVWVTGVEAEKDLGYAALHRLLRRFLPRTAQIPARQRDALDAAFGLVADAPRDRFLVGLATLTLLADVAVHEGLICVIDDAQWIDEDSLVVLAFVGRRLAADRMALLFGLRDTETPTPALAGLPTVSIQGLPDDVALELLATQVDVVDGDLGRRIVAATSGCPLALLELASELTEDQLRGAGVLSEPLPIGRRLEEHFHRQVLDLNQGAQRFLLVAATETSGDAALIRRAAAEIGAGAQAEDDATSSGLLTASSVVAFRHPLIRSAIYAGAPAELRRTAHNVLAANIDRESDPDRRARHLAAAARGPDEGLALELEQAAERARRRGGYSAEASFLLQAGQLTPDRQARATRLLSAATAALNAGLPQRAESMLEQARAGLQDPLLLAEALHLEGRLCVPLLNIPMAVGTLLDAARSFGPINPGQAREVLLEAANAGLVSQQFTVGAARHDVAELSLATSPKDPSDRTLTDELLDGAALLQRMDYARAVPHLRDAAETLARGSVSDDDILSRYSFGDMVANELWDEQVLERWSCRVEEFAREHGALFALQYALLALARADVRAGRFAAAEAHYDEAVEITRAKGGVPVLELFKVDLHAWRGDELETVQSATSLIELGSEFGLGTSVLIAHRALALLALSSGRYSDALNSVRPLVDQNHPAWTCHALSLAVEAGARSGDLEVAARCLEQLRERTTAAGTPWALAQLAQSQALMTGTAEAEDLFIEAISLFERTTVMTELVYAHLHYGEWLRRQNRRQDARKHLTVAHDRFSAMGAHGFAARAQIELAATGAKVRQRSVETQNDLTPQEAQVARLAAAGATNSEIGARLFISASTVDYHLRKVFRKEGISSRRELTSIELVTTGEDAP
jgi:DNA-binding CsgD family transcriptional regulator/tetratricopeptide (TPR) repeat protein